MKLRAIICIILTLLIFGTVHHLGPTRKYVVDTTAGEFYFAHEAQRFHISPRPEVDAKAGDLGEALLEVLALPAPTGDNLVEIEIETKTQGAPEWDTLPCSEIVFFEPDAPAPLTNPPASSILDRIESTGGGGAVYRFKIPCHPWTTKLLYRFVTRDGKGSKAQKILLAREELEPMMLRFKGEIPRFVLFPHILFMFIGICFLMLAMWSAVGLLRRRAEPAAARQARWAWAAMFIGGVPFGILMNYYAFDVYWEAVPFGNDVTDNKTQVALIFWGLASVFLTRRPGRHAAFFTLAAGLLSLAMYLIPHSL